MGKIRVYFLLTKNSGWTKTSFYAVGGHSVVKRKGICDL